MRVPTSQYHVCVAIGHSSQAHLGCDDPFPLLLLPAVALPSAAAAGGAIVTTAAAIRRPTVAVEEDGRSDDGSRKARLAAQQASRIKRPRLPRRAMF